MDAERHLKEKERLNQALNGNLARAVEDVTAALRKNNIDYSPGIAFDVCVYTIEELHLEKLNLSKYAQSLQEPA